VIWRRLLHRPQTVWLRKAVFQIHLWTGLAIAVYVCVISISGSAIVFRKDLQASRLEQRLITAETGQALSREQEAPSAIDHALGWLTNLHDNLLFGWRGRTINGIGSALVTLLALTGAVVWWPGVKNWRRSMTIQRNTRFARFNWDLHSSTGFWCVAFVLIWGISGVVFCFPGILDSLLNVHVRYWVTRLHFGRFNPVTKVVWTILGLSPAVLAVTGVIMWWNRVLSKTLARPHPTPRGRAAGVAVRAMQCDNETKVQK